MKKILAVVILMLPTLATAQVNKCVDARGKVVGYGNECPAGARAEKMDIKSAPASPGASPQKSLAERDADFRKRQIERKEAESKAETTAAETASQKRACSDAQAYLKDLQDRNRMTRTDPKTGERSYLTDAEYPKEIERTRQVMAANKC
jgi:hypothetical protein